MQQPSNDLAALRGFVDNETLATAQRRDAAEMLVGLKLSAVPEPAADDAEVVELQKSWSDAGPLGSIASMAWSTRNVANGWALSGPSLAQAAKHVHKRLKLRCLLAVVVDEAEHRLVRLEACRAILHDYMHTRNFYRKNNYSPERMLQETKPATGMKWEGLQQVPVARPPLCLGDVWAAR